MYNSQKLETAKMPLDDKTSVLHSYHETLYRKQKEKLLIHTTTWLDLQGIMLNEKCQSHKVPYCMILFTKHFEVTKLQDEKQIRGCQGLGMV